jgi:imidazoleglycerol-phosphate dehydratase/histidinol-phosphatase
VVAVSLAIYFKSGLHELTTEQALAFKDTIVLETSSWDEVYSFLKLGLRKVHHERNTNETKISIDVNMDGSGKASIDTGLGFFDHMLDQIARHGKIDLTITTQGDLHIDEHHTIEDTGIALGEAFAKALSDKRGMERYGFALPMDEADAKVLIDFGGRNWLVWNADFKREKIGEMPTEMFFHFFKSFSDGAKCNLNIECKGDNEHHKIEVIFKAFAKAIRMAVKRDPISNYLPSTKGVL